MKYDIGTPLDRNPARLQLMVKRNRKTGKTKIVLTASIFSTLVVGLAMALNQFML